MRYNIPFYDSAGTLNINSADPNQNLTAIDCPSGVWIVVFMRLKQEGNNIYFEIAYIDQSNTLHTDTERVLTDSYIKWQMTNTPKVLGMLSSGGIYIHRHFIDSEYITTGKIISVMMEGCADGICSSCIPHYYKTIAYSNICFGNTMIKNAQINAKPAQDLEWICAMSAL